MDVSVDFVLSPVINYAMQQNHVPVVRKLSVTNNSEEDWENITVALVAEPDFAAEWKQTITYLKKGQTFDLEAVHLNIASKFLAELTERIIGSLSLLISVQD